MIPYIEGCKTLQPSVFLSVIISHSAFLILFHVALLAQFVGHGAQFVVPCLAETANEGPFQETVDRQVQPTAFLYGRLAHHPAVVVQRHSAVGEAFFANGVERTADGLAETAAACAESLFQRAQTATADVLAAVLVGDVVIIGEHTVLPPHDAGHKIAFLVGVDHALTVYHGLSRGREVAPRHVYGIFNLHHFVECHGCSGIAFNAALALAGGQVAAELFGENVGRYEYFAYLQDGWK